MADVVIRLRAGIQSIKTRKYGRLESPLTNVSTGTVCMKIAIILILVSTFEKGVYVVVGFMWMWVIGGFIFGGREPLCDPSPMLTPKTH